MNKLYLLTRNTQYNRILLKSMRLAQEAHFSSSDNEKDKKEPTPAKKQNEEAINKLNELLKAMVEKDEVHTPTSKLQLAKPTDKRKKGAKKDDDRTTLKKSDATVKDVVTAAKKVAESLGGDMKKTESELLMKLLNGEKEATPINLVDIVKGMKVDTDKDMSKEKSRAQEVRQILQQSEGGDPNAKYPPRRPFRTSRTQHLEKIDLYGATPLNIFSADDEATEGVENKTWTKLYERDMKLAVTHPPSNYFQQMILWTEQGKVWKFPIDNEQGLEEEEKVYFAEHVFLDKHLEPWCPPKGPLRHFMELVCVGLSKNPYLTVEAKKEHIMWFKNYFEDKKQLLREVGALQEEKISPQPKHIEG